MGAGKALDRMEQGLGSGVAGRAFDKRELGGPLIREPRRELEGAPTSVHRLRIRAAFSFYRVRPSH